MYGNIVNREGAEIFVFTIYEGFKCVINVIRYIFGWPFVKRFALCYRIVVCLSVTLVYCGQTVWRIKMKLGMQVGLGPGHIVLDGDPALPTQRGTAPTQFLAHICCGQMAAWIKMPLGMELGQPRRLCVRWRPHSTLPKKAGRAPSTIFSPLLLWPNGCMHQDATWYGVRP